MYIYVASLQIEIDVHCTVVKVDKRLAKTINFGPTNNFGRFKTHIMVIQTNLFSSVQINQVYSLTKLINICSANYI